MREAKMLLSELMLERQDKPIGHDISYKSIKYKENYQNHVTFFFYKYIFAFCLKIIIMMMTCRGGNINITQRAQTVQKHTDCSILRVTVT